MKYLFILLLLSGCGSNTETKEEVVIKKSEAVKISHRGYNENRIDGFSSAIYSGYKILEADVRLRNGIPVLLHDDIYCECDTLESLLILARDNGIKLFIEFKETAAIDSSLELISQYNVDVVLTSFSSKDLNYINSVSNYELGYISEGSVDWSSLPTIDYLIINQNHIDQCIDGVKCAAWTITNQEQYNKIKLKVDYVIENKY